MSMNVRLPGALRSETDPNKSELNAKMTGNGERAVNKKSQGDRSASGMKGL
jgi:hypothetical protein